MSYKFLPSETILIDDYPMYSGYVYIIDGILTHCVSSETVGSYKKSFNVKEIRRCSLFEHLDAKLGDKVE